MTQNWHNFILLSMSFNLFNGIQNAACMPHFQNTASSDSDVYQLQDPLPYTGEYDAGYDDMHTLSIQKEKRLLQSMLRAAVESPPETERMDDDDDSEINIVIKRWNHFPPTGIRHHGNRRDKRLSVQLPLDILLSVISQPAPSSNRIYYKLQNIG